MLTTRRATSRTTCKYKFSQPLKSKVKILHLKKNFYTKLFSTCILPFLKKNLLETKLSPNFIKHPLRLHFLTLNLTEKGLK